MRLLVIFFFAAVIAGCNDQSSRLNEFAKNEVRSQLNNSHNITFHEVHFYTRENNGGIVCGKFSDERKLDHRFITAIYSQETDMKATKPHIEGEGTSTDIMDALWLAECK